MTVKTNSLLLLIIAETLVMAVWFSSSAVMTSLVREQSLSAFQSGLLSSSVQGGFAIGALIYAFFGIADRFDPRRVFACSALLAGGANAILLIVQADSMAAVASRALTGAFLAGVYPVGMKIAVGWGDKDRGLLVGLLVGALTLGSAGPHLLAFFGGADWRIAILFSSLAAGIGGVLTLFAGLGPHHAIAPKFSFTDLAPAWTDKRIRLAYTGYLGHMWELYAFWAWIGAALLAALSTKNIDGAEAIAKLITFFVIGIGALACVGAGALADRIGKAETTIVAMVGSASMAVLAALFFDGPPFLLIIITLFWGAFVIADSAQFSALVADAAPAQSAGALLTLQTALGFALTMLTVQATPLVANVVGWPGTFLLLALGPIIGVIAMAPLRRSRTATGK